MCHSRNTCNGPVTIPPYACSCWPGVCLLIGALLRCCCAGLQIQDLALALCQGGCLAGLATAEGGVTFHPEGHPQPDDSCLSSSGGTTNRVCTSTLGHVTTVCRMLEQACQCMWQQRSWWAALSHGALPPAFGCKPHMQYSPGLWATAVPSICCVVCRLGHSIAWSIQSQPRSIAHA